MRSSRRTLPTYQAALVALFMAAFQPTVRVEAPKDPIVIDLNVKIEREVRVKLEKDIEDLLEDDDESF